MTVIAEVAETIGWIPEESVAEKEIARNTCRPKFQIREWIIRTPKLG